MSKFLFNTHLFGFSVYQLLFWFLIYGIFGWIFESTTVSLSEKKVTNRGFLFGPFIPIYAFGITGFALLLNPINNLAPYNMNFAFLPVGKNIVPIHYNYFIMFFAGCIIASMLEYIVSFLMEKLFNQRWWDYTPYSYNIKGRVCLSITVCWGLLSIAAVKFVHPYIGMMITNHIPQKIGLIIIYAGYAIILVDTIASGITATKKKKELSGKEEKSK